MPEHHARADFLAIWAGLGGDYGHGNSKKHRPPRHLPRSEIKLPLLSISKSPAPLLTNTRPSARTRARLRFCQVMLNWPPSGQLRAQGQCSKANWGQLWGQLKICEARKLCLPMVIGRCSRGRTHSKRLAAMQAVFLWAPPAPAALFPRRQSRRFRPVLPRLHSPHCWPRRLGFLRLHSQDH